MEWGIGLGPLLSFLYGCSGTVNSPASVRVQDISIFFSLGAAEKRLSLAHVQGVIAAWVDAADEALCSAVGRMLD